MPYVQCNESVSYANSKHVPPTIPNTNAKFKQPNKAKLCGKEIMVRRSDDVYRTRSGRISKPTARLIASLQLYLHLLCIYIYFVLTTIVANHHMKFCVFKEIN